MEDKKIRQEDPTVVRTREERAGRNDQDDLDAKLAALRDGLENDILPEVKCGDPNMHYCWLSTTNKSDPIHRRLKIGYELVRSDELPEFRGDYRVKEGQFEGCVAVNEMILARIHKRLYQELMIINHHERPCREEELIKQNAQKSEHDREGRPIGGISDDDQGFRNIVDRRRAPTF